MRKFKRAMLREQMGTNKIRGAWRRMQLKKYSFRHWMNMYRACVGKIMAREAYLT